MQRSTIDHREVQTRGAATLQLQCAYRLGEVIDRRHDSHTAGSLGNHALSLQDPTTLIQDRLHAAGFGDRPDAPAVSIEIRQLYITANQFTKIPVVVYQFTVDGGNARIIRANAASMNWNGDREEALRGLSRALDDADAQLVAALNGACSDRT